MNFDHFQQPSGRFCIEFESLINIRPRLGNRSIVIQDEKLRLQVESVARQILGDTQ
jgi:hypothetical protein